MRILALVLAIAAGLVILAGYFVPAVAPIQAIILNWTIIRWGVATLVGVLNLVLVHGGKIAGREKGGVYSAILLVCLVATFVFGLVVGPDHPAMRRLVNGIIVPVEATLMAVLAITLLYASIRLLRRRTDLMSVVFLASAALMLVASATLPFGEVGVLDD